MEAVHDVMRELEPVRQARARIGEHGLDVLADDAVESGDLGVARPVAARWRGTRGAVNQLDVTRGAQAPLPDEAPHTVDAQPVTGYFDYVGSDAGVVGCQPDAPPALLVPTPRSARRGCGPPWGEPRS